MANNEIKFTAQSADLEKAQDRIAAGQEKIVRVLNEQVKTSRQAASEEAKKNREAIALLKEVQTQQEKIHASIQRTIQLNKEGKLSDEEATRIIRAKESALAGLQQKERESTPAYREQKAALEALFAAQEKESKAIAEKIQREEQLRKNTEAVLKIRQIRASEQQAIDAREAKASEAQRQRNVDALKRIHQIREAEQAAADRRRAHDVAELARKKEQKRADDELTQSGKRVHEETRTAAERYRAEIQRLQMLLNRGKITQEEYNRAVRNAKNAFKESVSAGNSYTAILSQIAGYLSAGGLLMKGLGIWKDAHRELIEQAGQLAEKYDDVIRKFNIEADLRGIQSDKAVASIQRAATRTATPFDQAMDIARQAVSAGMSVDEATGSGAEQLMRIFAASNFRGADLNPAELTKSLMQFLEANNLEKTGENVARVGQSAQLLFKATNMQIPAMTDLAKAAGAISNVTTPEEQMAAFSKLVGVMQDSDAATGLRNVVQRLAGAGASQRRVDTLASMGLKPEDVDFVGEDLITVLERMKGGLESLPEEQRQAALVKMFEEQGASSANVLMSDIPGIKANIEVQKDKATFESDVKEATTGRRAAGVRQRNIQEEFVRQQDQFDDLLRNELQAQLAQAGFNKFVQKKQAMYFDFFRSMGASPERSLQMAIPSSAFAGQAAAAGITPESIRIGVNEQAGENLIAPFSILEERRNNSGQRMHDVREAMLAPPAAAAVQPQPPMQPPRVEQILEQQLRQAEQAAREQKKQADEARKLNQAQQMELQRLGQQVQQLTTVTAGNKPQRPMPQSPMSFHNRGR